MWCIPMDSPNRGRCRTACEGKTLRERQRIGALAVAAVKRDQTLDRLMAAYQQLVDNGVVPWGSIPVNRVWADQAGVQVRTLQNHRTTLRAAIEGGARRCQDKKEREGGVFLPRLMKLLSLYLFLLPPASMTDTRIFESL